MSSWLGRTGGVELGTQGMLSERRVRQPYYRTAMLKGVDINTGRSFVLSPCLDLQCSPKRGTVVI